MNNSKHIRNQTKEFPNSLDVFSHLFDRLIATGGETGVHFDGPEKEAWVEISNDLDDWLELNFSFPFKGDFKEVVAQHGITIPSNWRFIQYRPKRFGGFFLGYACFSVPKQDSDLLIQFVEVLFTKLFSCEKGYSVSGHIT